MTPVTLQTAGVMPRVIEELGKPFAAGCVGWKPGATNQNKTKAIALAYIDARDVMDRLDTLVTMGLIDGWRDEYDPLQAGAVRCRLHLCIAGQWVGKEDVGGASAQPDAGDKMKAAFSDALKRAAVKWGIGRYLYHLDAPWCDYDGQKKKFTGTPKLPDWALPGGSGRPPAYSLPPHLVAEQHDDPAPAAGYPKAGNNGPAPQAQPKPAEKPQPQNGPELHAAINKFDATCAEKRYAARGAMLAHVTEAGVKAGYPTDMTKWAGPAIKFGMNTALDFFNARKDAAQKQPAGK